MPRKTYTEEFKRDGSRLVRELPRGFNPDHRHRSRGQPRHVGELGKKYGTATPTETPSPASVNEAEQIRKLERENARLREERDILRKAAKYFPGKRRIGDPLEGSLMTPRKTTRLSGYARS